MVVTLARTDWNLFSFNEILTMYSCSFSDINVSVASIQRSPSSEEDNSPTEMNNCRRLVDKPPLVCVAILASCFLLSLHSLNFYGRIPISLEILIRWWNRLLSVAICILVGGKMNGVD